jgi:hypothetical protein
MNGTTAVVQSLPAVGTSVAAFELENGGGTCAVAGLYSVNGTAFCDWPEPTGITGLKHGCSFSPTVQSNDGGALTVGSRAAEVTGTGVGSLTSEKEWTIK